MKKYYILALCIGFSASVSAQKKIEVREANENIGGGSNNALTVVIYENSASDIEKQWKSELKNFKGKVGTSKGEIFGDDLLIKDFGDNTVDVYSKIKDNKDGSVVLVVGYDLGGAYLSSGAHGDQFKAARNMVYDFAIKATKEGIGNQLKEAEKLEKKLEKDQEKLVSDKSSLEKDIESYKQKIKDAEAAIEQNKKDQETKKAEIAAQKKVVEEVDKKLKAVK